MSNVIGFVMTAIVHAAECDGSKRSTNCPAYLLVIPCPPLDVDGYVLLHLSEHLHTGFAQMLGKHLEKAMAKLPSPNPFTEAELRAGRVSLDYEPILDTDEKDELFNWLAEQMKVPSLIAEADWPAFVTPSDEDELPTELQQFAEKSGRAVGD
jgi:hypothetical protein